MLYADPEVRGEAARDAAGEGSGAGRGGCYGHDGRPERDGREVPGAAGRAGDSRDGEALRGCHLPPGERCGDAHGPGMDPQAGTDQGWRGAEDGAEGSPGARGPCQRRPDPREG